MWRQHLTMELRVTYWPRPFASASKASTLDENRIGQQGQYRRIGSSTVPGLRDADLNDPTREGRNGVPNSAEYAALHRSDLIRELSVEDLVPCHLETVVSSPPPHTERALTDIVVPTGSANASFMSIFPYVGDVKAPSRRTVAL